jgi:hypothetical protein
MPQAQIGKLKPGKIRYHYLEAISTVGMGESDVEGLKDRVFGLMREKLLSLG